MKKLLGSLLILLIIPSYLWANACQSTGTGNWNIAGTWTNCGGTTPQAADTFQVMDNHVVTLDTNATVAGGTVGSSSVGAVLVLGQNYQLATTEDLECRYNGTIKWQAGSDLNIASTKNLRLGRCALASDTTNPPTASAMGKVTGAGGIATSTQRGDTTPKQQIGTSGTPLQYISFQNTGDITVAIYGTSGTLTNGLHLSHCVFVGNGYPKFGQGGVTPTSTSMTMDNCDFRDGTGTEMLRWNRAAGTITADQWIRNCTFSQSSAKKTLQIMASEGLTFTGNVLHHVSLVFNNTTGNVTFSNIALLFESIIGNPGMTLAKGNGAYTVASSYFYVYAHDHTISSSIASGSSTFTVTGNVFESPAGVQPDCVLIKEVPVLMTYNIVIGGGNLYGYDWIHDTNANVQKNNTYWGGSFAWANGENNAIQGPISISNGLAVRPSGSTANFILNGSRTYGLTIDYLGYNRKYGITNWSGGGAGVTITTDTNNSDISSLPPDNGFIDPTRNLAKWDLVMGSGTGTTAAAITYLLGLNGYRGTPYFDQGRTVPAHSVAKLVEWVRYGFSPTIASLRNAGDPADGSPTIGAMPYQNP